MVGVEENSDAFIRAQEQETEDSPENSNSNSEANKKKRKKKKKKPAANGQEPAAAQPSKQETDQRFNTALSELQRNTTESTWIRLEGCNIFDVKARKIANALAKNKELTSLDLSRNSISENGVEALANALNNGAAPELILLDLRENPVDGSLPCLESLKKARRELKVETGSKPQVDTATPSPNPGDPDGDEMLRSKVLLQQREQLAKAVGGSPPKASSPPGQAGAQANGFMQRYFQEGVQNGSPQPEGEAPEDPEKASARYWDEVSKSLDQKPVEVSALSSALRECALGVRREMELSEAPIPSSTRLEQLKPFTRRAVLNLGRLRAVLDVPAPSFVRQFSKERPVSAAGSHCGMCAQILERLLFGRCASINVHIIKAGLLPRLGHFGFDYPKNNVIQAAYLQCVRWALESGLRPLWEPLFKQRMGVAVGVKGKLRPGTLVTRIADTLRKREGSSIGLRDCDAGFAASLGNCLLEVAETNSDVAACLEASEGWSALTAEGSTLRSILAEQQGELCGPRPSRTMLPILDQQGTTDVDLAQAFKAPMPLEDDGATLLKLLSQEIQGEAFDGNHADTDSDEGDKNENDQPNGSGPHVTGSS